MRAVPNMIPIAECKPGYLYRVQTRNLGVAVFTGDKQSHFVGLRNKFGSTFLEYELHWDADEHFGTASPTEVLEKCPVENLETDIGLICANCRGPAFKFGGDHHVGEDCGNIKVVWGKNTELYEYIEAKDIEYGRG